MNGTKQTLFLALSVATLVAGGAAQQLGANPAQPALSAAVPVITTSGTASTVTTCCAGIITTLAGTGTTGIRSIAADAAGDVFFSDITSATVRVVYEGGSIAASLITAENPAVTAPVVGNIYVLVGAEGVSGTPTNGELGTTARLNISAGIVALDAAGDVFFNNTATNSIWVLYAGGTKTAGTNLISIEAGVTSPVLGHIYEVAGGNSTAGYGGNGLLATASGVQFHGINDVKLDAVGNMYIVDNGNNCIREVSAQTGIVSAFAGTPGTAGNTVNVVNATAVATSAELNAPYAVAVDPAGDVYIADKNNSQIKVVYEGGAQAAALISLENSTITLASLVNGNMYLIAGSGKTATPFGGLATASSLPGPTMVALDYAGNLYIAGTYIEEINAATGRMVTVAGNGTTGYSGDGGLATSAAMAAVRCVAVDAGGRIYITDAPNARIREVSQGIMNFVGEPVGTTSTPELIQFTNTGSATLTFTGTPTIAGTNAGDFALDSAFTIASPSPYTSSSALCTASTSLAVGASCLLAVTYTPLAPGTSSATMSIATNDPLSPHVIQLAGELTPTTTTLVPSTYTVYPGQTVTLTASVSALGGSPTGSVTFYQGSTLIDTVNPIPSSDTATFTLPTLAAGTYTYTAVYSGDTNFAGSTSAVITVDSNTFTLSLSPTALTVVPGGTAATTLTILGTGPAQLLSLSCTGPSILGCAFTPLSVSLAAAGTATVNLEVAAAPTTPVASIPAPSRGFALALLPFGTLLAFGMSMRRRRWNVALLACLLCFGSLGMLSGCSQKSNIGTTLGSSTQTVMVNVTGESDSVPFTQSVALTVYIQ
jgi:hypothetical protein